MREVHGHEGSALNNAIDIRCEDRDENGGAYNYQILFPDEVGREGLKNVRGITFHKGPLRETGRVNGISDEALIAIVIDRLEGFNTGPFRCRENSIAVTHLETALLWLQKRTASRQRRGVEGTHEV